MRFHHLFAGEGQELPREPRRALRRAQDFREIALQRGAFRGAVEGSLCKAADDGQHVIEIVRDAAGQPRHGVLLFLAEALLLGESAGVDRRTLLDVIGASVIGSRFVDYKTEPLLRDDYSATFTTAMMVKDVDLVLDQAAASDVELPLTRELRSLLDEAIAGGHADQDFASLVLHLRERAARAPKSEREQVIT